MEQQEKPFKINHLMKKIILTSLLFLAIIFNSFSQQGVTTFGLQYKPIIPVNFLTVENLELKEGEYSSTISQKVGYNFGAVIRWGISKNISIESGLSYIKRNYTFDNAIDSSNLKESGSFGMIVFEFPIQGLMYVRLDKRLYMNVATGLSANWRASSVGSFSDNKNFSQVSYIRKLNFAYIANIGFEYRTKKSGYIYLGASLTNPFSSLGIIETSYRVNNQKKQTLRGDLSGNYISVDLRYFFHDSKKKKKKEK